MFRYRRLVVAAVREKNRRDIGVEAVRLAAAVVLRQGIEEKPTRSTKKMISAREDRAKATRETLEERELVAEVAVRIVVE